MLKIYCEVFMESFSGHLMEEISLVQTKTQCPNEIILNFQNILSETLEADSSVNWDGLLIDSFTGKKPSVPTLKEIPRKPERGDIRYCPRFNIVEKIFPRFRKKKEKAATAKFKGDVEFWTKSVEKINESNRLLKDSYLESVRKWKHNEIILGLKNKYFRKNSAVILDYCNMILIRSAWPACFPNKWNLSYHESSNTLLIDFLLPFVKGLQKKYISTDSGFSRVDISKIYSQLPYKIVFKIMHEVFSGDKVNSIDSVVLNGWVKSNEKNAGKTPYFCDLSVQCTKEKFFSLPLEAVNPKVCFEQLDGLKYGKINYEIMPFMSINEEINDFLLEGLHW